MKKRVERQIHAESVFLEPIQSKEGKWYWRVKSFGYDAEIYDEHNNCFASVQTEAYSETELLVKKGV